MDDLEEKLKILPKNIEVDSVKYQLFYYETHIINKLYINYNNSKGFLFVIYLTEYDTAISEAFFKLQEFNYKEVL